jgi:hypothetical protein
MPKMSSPGKALAFTLVGALISITLTLYIKKTPSYPWLIPLIFWIVTLSLYGAGVFAPLEWVRKRIRTGVKLCLLKPRIGILKDIPWEEKYKLYATYTDLSPEGWEEKINLAAKNNRVKVRVRRITTKKNFHGYMIVLNPYGGAYPERNQQTFATLDEIFEYVAKGGLFVNIADVPGFYANSPKLHHRVAVGRGVFRGLKNQGNILQTPFMQRLGLDVYPGDYRDLVLVEKVKISSEISLKGDRAVQSTLEDYPILDPVVKPQEDRGVTLTQSFFKTYGDGKFLISMLPITKAENPMMVDVLTKIVIYEVQQATLSAKDKKEAWSHLDS